MQPSTIPGEVKPQRGTWDCLAQVCGQYLGKSLVSKGYDCRDAAALPPARSRN